VKHETQQHDRESAEEVRPASEEKRSYEPPKVESVRLTPEAAEALT